jgi:phosphoglycolate phosphatase-like HAD superfamily hydrolase
MKISFDFDGTLARKKIRAVAVALRNAGNDVYITTSRDENESLKNWKVYEMAAELGLTADKIIFTNGENKHHFLKAFDIHFDNDHKQIESISKHIPTIACFLVNNYKSV